MSREVTTIGITLQYAVETVPGTRPTTGYVPVLDVVSTPEYNSEPSTNDATPLDELNYPRQVRALPDAPGSFSYTANFGDEFMTTWDTLVTAFETGKAAGLDTWFTEVVPENLKSFYWTGEPSPLGKPGAEVNGVYQGSASITPIRTTGYAAKPV
jgi:hypothetical protein